MNPVVLLGLRAEARRPLAHWLRLGVAACFFALLESALHARGPLEPTCRLLFPLLHGMLFVPSLVAGPVLLVEELARERRQRTLELLLLTPLRLSTVLHAKTAVFVARAMVLVVGALPVVSFTFLFGGVSPWEMALLLVLHALALALSLSAGMVAGCWGRTWAQSMTLALALVAAGIVLVGGSAFVLFQALVGGPHAAELWPAPHTAAGWLSGAARFLANADGIWGRTLATLPPAVTEAWAWLMASVLLATGLLAVGMGAVARSMLRRSLRVGPGPRPGRGLASEILPRASRLAARVPARVRRQWLRRNPVQWLMRYRAEVRVLRWAGAVAMAAAHGLVAWSRPEPASWMAIELALALALGVLLALAAAGSFRVEREEGAWEMLLVAPLEDREFFWGRVGGLWWQFGPAFAAWVVGLAFTVPPSLMESAGPILVAWTASVGAATPVIGLDAAFHFRSHRKAALVTLAAGVGAGGFLLWMSLRGEGAPGLAILSILPPWLAAAQCGPGFWHRLRAQRHGRHRLPWPRPTGRR